MSNEDTTFLKARVAYLETLLVSFAEAAKHIDPCFNHDDCIATVARGRKEGALTLLQAGHYRLALDAIRNPDRIALPSFEELHECHTQS